MPGTPLIFTLGMMERLNCGGTRIWFLTAWHRWSTLSMVTSSGGVGHGNSTRLLLWILTGWRTAITFKGRTRRGNNPHFAECLEVEFQEQGARTEAWDLSRLALIATTSKWMASP